MSRQVRILVVEDETIIARDIQMGLKNLGYDVPAVAHSAEMAIKQVEQTSPDLVLMDITLKGNLDGIETAALIRRRFDIPIIYLTAHADEATFERAKQTAPYGYLLKPFEERELHTTVEVALFKSKMERQLKATNQELEAFTYTISHDLRSPLRAIQGFSRIMLDEYRDDMPAGAVRYAEMVRDNAKLMGNLIDALLAFSRLGRQAIKKRQVDPREIVNQVIDDLKVPADGSIELAIKYLPPCEADPTLLKQVYMNLLSNAVKYSRGRSPAVIEVGHEECNGLPTYYVKDNGAGFNMAYASKLFCVFQRLHLDDEFEGTGVGLAIVKRIVERHGGNVMAEGAEGQGAKFSFTLTGRSINEDQ